MFNKYNFSIANIPIENSTRPEISGVFIKPNESVATDSFCMIKVSTPKVNISDYPKVQNKPKPIINFKPFILPRQKAKDIKDIISKIKNDTFPILSNAVLYHRDDRQVEIGATDLESCQSVLSNVIEGEYPKYNEIFLKKGKYIKISVNPDFLIKIASFFSSFNKDKTIEMEIPENPRSPIRFYAKNKDTGQEATALIMPRDN